MDYLQNNEIFEQISCYNNEEKRIQIDRIY